jgi:hypothetical protein
MLSITAAVIMLSAPALHLQINASLDASPADQGVYNTTKWQPPKPFVADKVCGTNLLCLQHPVAVLLLAGMLD